MTNPAYGEASADRIAETDAMLAHFAQTANHSEYWSRFAAVEQRMNAENLMGRFAESDRIRAELGRINRELQPMLRAQYDAIQVPAVRHTASAINFIQGALSARKHEVA